MGGVAVVGSRTLFRAGLVSLLNTMGFEPMEEADDVKNIQRGMGAKSSPAVLVVSLMRGLEDVVGAAGEIRAAIPAAKTVFILPRLDLETMSGCFAAGASGYLLESISREALCESLKLVDSGEKVFPSELASLFPKLASNVVNTDPDPLAPAKSNLSTREIEILRCLTNGQSNKAIARNLQIAEATVKVHIKRILRKAKVVNRTQAALWGVATGVAPSPPPSKILADNLAR